MKVLVLDSFNHSFNNKLPEVELFVRLRKLGIDITIAGKGIKETIDYLKKHDIKLIDLEPKSKYDYEYINNVKKILKDENFDVLHLFTGNHMRNGIMAAYNTNVKVAVYFGSTSLYWHDPSAYFKYLNPRINKILCNSNHVYNHVKKQLLFNKNKAIKIYKGFDTTWYDNYSSFDFSTIGIPKGSIIVTSIARNTKVKGVKYFLQATKHIDYFPNVHFVHVGKYMDNKEISDLIEESPYKDNIHIMGYRTDAVEILKASDIYVQTSLDEGLGRAVSEACILKKPIVMTNAGGCTELIEDKKGGFVVPLKDPVSIAEAILVLLKDEKLRISMGKNAFNYLKENFDINTTAKETYDTYNEMMSK